MTFGRELRQHNKINSTIPRRRHPGRRLVWAAACEAILSDGRGLVKERKPECFRASRQFSPTNDRPLVRLPRVRPPTAL